METVKLYHCYDYSKDCWLIEMVLDVPVYSLNLTRFRVPEADVNKSDWQCAFLQQYLNADGTEKLCSMYEEPEENVQPCRIAFFLFKTTGQVLSTPYGDFPLDHPAPLPDRLVTIIESVEPD